MGKYSRPNELMKFPDPGVVQEGQVWIADNGYGYVYSTANERWEVVTGPHSGHVWVSLTPPEEDKNRLKPICPGEFWYDQASKTLKFI